MLHTTFPQEAVGQAHNLTAAYGQAHIGLDRAAAEFRESLGPVLDRLGEAAVPYLRDVCRRIERQIDEAEHAEPLLHDQVTDWMNDRVIVASRALLHAVEDEARVKGIAI